MIFFISLVLAVCILFITAYISYIVGRLCSKRRIAKLKRVRSITIEEAIKKVKSNDGWLFTYDKDEFFMSELFWIPSDISPDRIFDLERWLKKEAYYVSRHASLQECLEHFDELTKQRFVECTVMKLSDPASAFLSISSNSKPFDPKSHFLENGVKTETENQDSMMFNRKNEKLI